MMKISVYITSYNQKDYLREAIESVLAQTLKAHEIIVIDDCSGDGSQELIADYEKRYPGLVRGLYHQANTGVAQSRVDALMAVTGDYVTYLDGDDRYLPTKLEKEAQVLRENPQAQIAFSNNYYMSEDGSQYLWKWIEKVKPPEGYVFKETFTRDYPMKSLFRMELVHYGSWKKIGFHYPGLHVFEDYDMRIRLTKHLNTAYYDEPLTEIRSHDHGLSKSRRETMLFALDTILERNRPLLDDLNPKERRKLIRQYKFYQAKAVNVVVFENFLGLFKRQSTFRQFVKSLARYFKWPLNILVTAKLFINFLIGKIKKTWNLF
ncbi:MAG: glycosyltransferase family 2 protein [Spirochaetota bacterium]|nr:glycosyltransferase family 2 protein [Spirochaetota bacterium]